MDAARTTEHRNSQIRTRPDPVNPSAIELDARTQRHIRIPYGLRRVSRHQLVRLAPLADPTSGDIALARVERIGKNTRLELANGRPCTLHVGDLVAGVFGNRYATMQFEGYAKRSGDCCDLMSMGGLCGLVESKHDSIAESTKLRLLGALAGADGRALRLRDFSAPRTESLVWPQVVVVCGTSMDSGKTYTAASLIEGFAHKNVDVAGIKLTGTAAGRDTWGMLDAGACVALDFIDGGYPSTYLTPLDELLSLHELLVAQAVANGARWVVIEIADGLLEQETAALLQCPDFTRTVNEWMFAAGDPLAAVAGVERLRQWGIHPAAVSGRTTMSSLSLREAEAATGLPCLTARALQRGDLAEIWLAAAVPDPAPLAAVAP